MFEKKNKCEYIDNKKNKCLFFEYYMENKIFIT